MILPDHITTITVTEPVFFGAMFRDLHILDTCIPYDWQAKDMGASYARRIDQPLVHSAGSLSPTIWTNYLVDMSMGKDVSPPTELLVTTVATYGQALLDKLTTYFRNNPDNLTLYGFEEFLNGENITGTSRKMLYLTELDSIIAATIRGMHCASPKDYQKYKGMVNALLQHADLTVTGQPNGALAESIALPQLPLIFTEDKQQKVSINSLNAQQLRGYNFMTTLERGANAITHRSAQLALPLLARRNLYTRTLY